MNATTTAKIFAVAVAIAAPIAGIGTVPVEAGQSHPTENWDVDTQEGVPTRVVTAEDGTVTVNVLPEGDAPVHGFVLSPTGELVTIF